MGHLTRIWPLGQNISIPYGYLVGLKDLLKEKDMPIELILIMEAGILDEEGAFS